jgi:uncharacterized protein with GYD domain
MGTYLMFGKYSTDALEGISVERTEKGASLIKGYGGEVKHIFALLGQHDLVLVVDFPGIEQAMKASVALGKLTGISFDTSPAVAVEEFDKMMTDV